MLAEARRSAILTAVKRERIVRVADLAALLNVSLMTVRRDIDALDEAGLLERIHGGAKVSGGPGTHEPGFEQKSSQALAEKEAIAAEAAKLAQEGMAIGMSAGTTTFVLAQRLARVPHLTIVTNSLRVADVFHSSAVKSTVLLTGGERTPSDALVGPIATSSVRQLHLDLLYLGVHGMDEKAGFTTPNVLEAEMDRALVEASRRVVVVADHSKWGTLGISTIAPLQRADEVITDALLGSEAQRILRNKVGRLKLVQVSPDELN